MTPEMKRRLTVQRYTSTDLRVQIGETDDGEACFHVWNSRERSLEEVPVELSLLEKGELDIDFFSL